MSLAGHLLREAAAVAAREAARRWRIDPWAASKLTPIALSLLMQGYKRQSRTPLGAAHLAFRLSGHQEDLLKNERRLSAADVRARGDALSEKALGPGRARATQALAELAAINPAAAAGLLSMTAAAATSALAKAQRELRLNPLELRGVVKCEAARVDDADPSLVDQVREWVFRPAWPQRVWANAQGWAQRAGRARLVIPAE